MNQEECEVYQVSKDKMKVLIGLAPRMQPFDESMESLMQMVNFTQQAGINLCMEKVRRGAPGWHNWGPLVAHCIKLECSHLFFAADDMIYPKDTIVRLLHDDKDVVSGIYRKAPVLRIEPAVSCTNWNSPELWKEKYDARGVYETDFVAGHTMLVKKEVLEKMIIDYPELSYINPSYPDETHYGLSLPIIEDKRAYQDDWAFSVRARRSGFKLWADFGCRCKHYCFDFLGFEAEE